MNKSRSDRTSNGNLETFYKLTVPRRLEMRSGETQQLIQMIDHALKSHLKNAAKRNSSQKASRYQTF